ncbi:CIR protein [Plasmodium chabaudi chabaudi]|uniref:CIR protein n=2 Tax=Plasmodium chabaudi chabaudi TaxID=31271 RepID=A0A1C6W7L4_PLACU|nr:CIR protein [Plasmodium chabaudi chabaudi]
MFKGVCEEINIMGKYIVVKQEGSGVNIEFDNKLDDYCPNKNNGINGQCETNDEKISAGFIWLLVMFEHLCDEECPQNEKDRYVEYAILWLSYMLNQISNEGISTLKNFYTNHIENNTNYTSHVSSASDSNYKGIVDKKINLMNMNKNIISKFYEVLKSLCSMHTECIGCKSNCTDCLEKAKDFADKYNKLNENSDTNQSDSYKNVLYSLSTDYNNLKNYLIENCTDCNDTSSFPEIKAPQGSFQIFEATSPISSIASILIPVLLTFSITFFLGIAYKYSLFGFDKRLNRQYLREKIKKIKKKMNRYI